jgi:hypothetical protein
VIHYLPGEKNMSTLWNAQDVAIAAKTWDRSWRGEEFTELGTDFHIVMHMQRVTVDADNKVIGKEPLPNITRSLSQVINDPDVQAYLALKQTLVKKWLDEDNTPPVVEPPAPDPIPAP